MKVTALIPDNIIHELGALTRAKTITESLIVALQEWISLQKLKALNREIKAHPLHFQDGFSATQVRQFERPSL